jgi:hypothetical protein
MAPKLTYQKRLSGVAAGTTSEHLRQAFSNLSYIEDHLNEHAPQPAWSIQEEAELEEVAVLLQLAHKKLKRLGIDRALKEMRE